MIKERNFREFYKLFNEAGLKLKRRHCCGSCARVEYLPGYGVRLSCLCGEGVLILKRAMYPDIKTEKDFVCFAVEEWNAGHTNW